jgi:hypothetical protein
MIALHDLSANNSKPYLIFFGPAIAQDTGGSFFLIASGR